MQLKADGDITEQTIRINN